VVRDSRGEPIERERARETGAVTGPLGMKLKQQLPPGGKGAMLSGIHCPPGEWNETHPPLEVLVRLAKALKVTVGKLLE